MQLFRPSNDCYEQSYTQNSSINPYFGPKPTGYGVGNNLTQCQTQTQCFDAQVPSAGSGYGMQQYAAGARGYGNQKHYGQFAQHGSYGSVQHGGTNVATHESTHGMMHGACQANLASVFEENRSSGVWHRPQGFVASGHHGTAHHGSSFGSGCEAQSGGGYKYSMKKRERRSWGRTRSGNDSDDSGCSDESDNEK